MIYDKTTTSVGEERPSSLTSFDKVFKTISHTILVSSLQTGKTYWKDQNPRVMGIRLHSISMPVTSEALHGSILRVVLLNTFSNATEEVTEHTLFKSAKHQHKGSCQYTWGQGWHQGESVKAWGTGRQRASPPWESPTVPQVFQRGALPPSLQFPSCDWIKPRAAWAEPRANCPKQGLDSSPLLRSLPSQTTLGSYPCLHPLAAWNGERISGPAFTHRRESFRQDFKLAELARLDFR